MTATDIGEVAIDEQFDPNKLTKPQLRSLLISYDVTDIPPPSHRKEELIRLVQERIVTPHLASLKDKKKTPVRASTHGIEFADGSGRVPSPAQNGSFSQENPFQSPSVREKKRQPPVQPAHQVQAPTKKGLLERLADGEENSPKQTPSKRAAVALPSKLIFEDNRAGERCSQTLRLCNWIAALIKGFVCALVFLVIFVWVYFRFISPPPFCPSGTVRPPFGTIRSFRSLFDWVGEFCISCPAHGTCDKYGQLRCDEKFVECKKLLFGSKCVPDHRKISALESLGSAAKRILNEHLGSRQVNQSLPLGLPEAELKQRLVAATSGTLFASAIPFSDLFRLLILEIQSNSVEGIGSVTSGGQTLYHGKDPIFPVPYRLKRWAAGLIVRNFRFLLSLAVVIIGWSAFRKRLAHSNLMHKTVDSLVSQAFLRLQQQESDARSANFKAPSFLSIAQLRDTLLMAISLDLSSKKIVWQRVCRAVSGNANVRETVCSVRGEQHKVWEWIGPAAPIKQSAEMCEKESFKR